MKRYSRSRRASAYLTALIASAALTSSAVAFAADSSSSESNGSAEIVSALGTQGSGIVGAINNLIAGYGKDQWATQLNVATPFIGNTMGIGQGQAIIMSGNVTAPPPVAPNSDTPLTTQAILNILHTTSSNADEAIRSLINTTCSTSTDVAVDASKDCLADLNAATSKSYDANSLLTPLAYQDGGAAARNAILFISSVAQPVEAVDFNTVKEVLASPLPHPALTYLAAIRSYAAAQSVGLRNLYQLYAERLIVPGLGEKAGVLDANKKPVADASPLQVAEYGAKRRVTDTEWYKQMEKASPATISRETLYVLAEIRLELYKQRLATENLNAVMSAMELQSNSSASKFNLDQLKRALQPKSSDSSSGIPGM